MPRVVVVELLAPLLLLGLGQQQQPAATKLGGGPEDAAAFLYWLIKQPPRPVEPVKLGRMDLPWKKRHLKRAQTTKMINMLQALQQARLFSAYMVR